MSNLFARLNVITETEHDNELVNPSLPVRPPPPHFLRRPDVSVVADDDPEEVEDYPRTPSPKKVHASSEWISRRSKVERDAFVHYRTSQIKTVKTMLKNSQIQPGCHVWSKDPLISDLPDVQQLQGQRRRRPKVHGLVKHRSHSQPRFWMVHFDNGKDLYCAEDILHFYKEDQHNSVDHSGSSDTIFPKEIELSTPEILKCQQDEIMERILNSKIHKTPGYDTVSYSRIVATFKPQYNWIEERKLRNFVYRKQQKLNCEVTPESWLRKLDSNNQITKNDDINLPKKVTKTRNSIINKSKSVFETDLGHIKGSKNIVSKPKHKPQWLLKFRENNKESYHNYSYSSSDDDSIFDYNPFNLQKKEKNNDKCEYLLINKSMYLLITCLNNTYLNFMLKYMK